MAFERIETRLRAGNIGAIASMSLGGPGSKDGRAAVIVSLRKDLVEKAGFAELKSFSVYLGIDGDEGMLQIVADVHGIMTARHAPGSKAMLLNLGHVPSIGAVKCRKQPANATVTEIGTVLLEIPDFGSGGKAATPAAAKAPAKAADKSGAAKTPAGPVNQGTVDRLQAAVATAHRKVETEHFNGVTISFAHDAETVSFKGQSMEVTLRQAVFVQTLARCRPAPVAESFLIGKLWGVKPSNAAQQLKTLADDLHGGLLPIGLNLNLVKGVGYQLKDRA
jgi:hypothetical protein